jgi:hypothetical protein
MKPCSLHQQEKLVSEKEIYKLLSTQFYGVCLSINKEINDFGPMMVFPLMLGGP